MGRLDHQGGAILTELTKPVRRLSSASRYSRGKMRRIVVTLQPNGLGLRLAKERKTFSLPFGDLYALAVRVTLAAEKARKLAERKARSKAR